MYPDHPTRVLLAVVEIYERDGCVTMTDVVDRTGFARATVYKWLVRLYDAGLVTWEESRQATLVPLVRPVAIAGSVR
jgi:DNA-binding IclR family transcriptional regulator